MSVWKRLLKPAMIVCLLSDCQSEHPGTGVLNIGHFDRVRFNPIGGR